MTNPLQAIPAKVRLWLYLVYATLGPVLLYTKAQGWTGTAEIDLWVGLGVAPLASPPRRISRPHLESSRTSRSAWRSWPMVT